jgi:hypothetical protein
MADRQRKGIFWRNDEITLVRGLDLAPSVSVSGDTAESSLRNLHAARGCLPGTSHHKSKNAP